MFSMPWFVSKLGLKRVLLLGMLSWAVRYLFFTSPAFSMALIGLILHGMCYSFFYVGAYMWIDRRAPAELKSSAQSLIAFLLLGVGYFLGAQGGGQMIEQFPAPVTEMAAVNPETGESAGDAGLPRWSDPDAATSAWRYLDLSTTLKRAMGEEVPEPGPDMAAQLDANKDGTITLEEVEAYDEPILVVDGTGYAKENLSDVFKTIHDELELTGPVALTREQWLAAQSNDWQPIWFWPAVGCFVILAFFALGFQDKQIAAEPTPSGEEVGEDHAGASATAPPADEPPAGQSS
jgi:hypothetical protein